MVYRTCLENKSTARYRGFESHPLRMKVVLISCVSKKLPHRARAKDLYISTLFRGNMAYAKKLKAQKIFILSAKYGLVAPEQYIDTYNQTLNTLGTAARKKWAEKVFMQLKKKTNPQKDMFVFLAGKNYRQFLAPHLKNVSVPMEGLGIGKQLQYLKRHAG